MSNTIDYGTLMHNAMRSLIRRVLTDVEKNGLPGAHHFFITFDTRHPEAKLASWLHDRYPHEMIIVIQHWSVSTEVIVARFSVTHHFAHVPVPLNVLYDSLKTLLATASDLGLPFAPS